MDLIQHINDVNYFEIHFFDKCNTTKDYTQVGLHVDAFWHLLESMHKTNYKYFQREYKEYILNDLTCQMFTNDDVKVYKNTVVGVDIHDDLFIAKYNRSKMTLLNFPSTTMIHNTSYVKQMIFRISNRIYLNFKIQIDRNRTKTYTVFINYNHEDNVDLSLINKSIATLLGEIRSQVPIC